MGSSGPDSHIEQGRQLWESGLCNEAILSWRQALAADPNSVEAMISLAWALAQQEGAEEALALASRAIEVSPQSAPAHRVVGELLFLKGQYQEAVGHYLTGLKHDDGDCAKLTACLHRDLGDAFYLLGQFPEAQCAYEASLACYSNQAYCHLWLGWTKQRLGDPDGAVSAFQAAYRIAPEWHEACYAAGQASCVRGDYELARQRLEQALSSCPAEDEEAHAAIICELGNVFRGLGDLPPAIDLYHKALSLDPTHAAARFNLGLAYCDSGEYEAGLTTFEIAAQLNPDDPEIWVEKGRACLELGRYDEALDSYQAVLKIQSDSAEAFSGLGLTYYSLGIYESSAEHYRSAAELAPSDPWPRYNLALALEAAGQTAEADQAIAETWELGKDDCDVCVAIARVLTFQGRELEGAIRAARRSCQLEPESAEAHNALAMALFNTGDCKAALGPAQRAAELMPEVAEYHYDLGLIQESLGNLELAWGCFCRAVKLSPDHEEAQQALRRLEDAG